MTDPPITAALRAWRQGDEAAEDELIRLVYPDLHRRAERLLRAERPDHTLQPTALVHEAYLRLLDQKRVDWNDRLHFFAIAARVMRRVLLDHARRRHRQRRGGDAVAVSLDVIAEPAAPSAALDVERLDEALGELAAFDPDAAALVELRFFGGLTLEETAQALDSSTATVGRQWRTARAWLYDRLRDGRGG
jgi:RNA polymerase sigma factor (TIGR02999 family)